MVTTARARQDAFLFLSHPTQVALTVPMVPPPPLSTLRLSPFIQPAAGRGPRVLAEPLRERTMSSEVLPGRPRSRLKGESERLTSAINCL